MLSVDESTQERWRKNEGGESAAETRRRNLENNVKNAQASVADDAGRDTSNLLAQMGRPLSSEEVIRRLRLCNPSLYFERAKSDPTKYGIYLICPEGKLYATADGRILTIKHIMGMEFGIMPEFSVLHRRTMDVPRNELFAQPKATRDISWDKTQTFADETRGWRTVLARLLKARLITPWQIDKYFGSVPSHDSEKWQKHTT